MEDAGADKLAAGQIVAALAEAEPWRAHYAHPCAWDQTFPPLSLPAMFLASAAEYPERPLVEFMGRRYSYRQLAAEARAFAAGLALLGIRRGDRVGLFLPLSLIHI